MVYEKLKQGGIVADKLLAAVEAAGDGIGIVDHDGNLIYMNRALMELHGIRREELGQYLGRGWENLYSDKGRQDIAGKVMPVLKRQKFWRGESPIVRRDGNIMIAEMSLTLLEDGGFIGTARDVTGHKQAEQEKEALYRQLSQAQKMEAVGRLTGGIAHDFNNMLTVISGNLELLEDMIQEMPEAAKSVASMRRATQRGADLTQRLLAFSRQQILKPQVVNVNGIIPETVKLIRRAVSEDVDIATGMDESLWETKIDTGQLENALLNLAINARDAMPGGGQLRISTFNLALAENSPQRASYMKPGDYAVIAVADTGSGIPPEIIGRVFEPFFTTKQPGQGTGLGLSMVYGFVKQSGGYVTIDSAPGDGTTIRLFFPRAAPEAAAPAPRGKAGSSDLPRGDETVLIVEDEEEILDLNRNLLTRLGYKAQGARNGAEAILLLERLQRLDLLVTDIAMPGGIDGRELAVEARSMFPLLKILFVSGYVREAKDADDLPQGAALLQKPYSREVFAGAVRRLLDGENKEGGA